MTLVGDEQMSVIEDILIDYMRKMAQEGPIADNIFNASEAGFCPLRIYYTRRAKDVPEPEEFLYLKMRGTLMHLGVLYIVKQENPLAETEVPFEREIEGITIKGRVDVLVNHTVEELKTVSKIPPKPYEEHIAQVQIYMWLTGCHDANIVYYDVNTGKMKSYHIEKDDLVINDIINKFLYVYECLMKDLEPSYKVSSFCSLCKYKPFCPAFKNTKLFFKGQSITEIPY